MSLEKFVMDDEICSTIRRIVRGVDINEETLALNLIREVGPGGQFLTCEHTLNHFRNEFWQPQLCDRSNYDVWRIAGSKESLRRAEVRVQQILSDYIPPIIEEGIDCYLRQFAGLN
jgi:trimethylamine--corrinoid protein Co-methyltransferase